MRVAFALLFLYAVPALAKDAHIVSLGGHGTTEGVVVRGRVYKGRPSSGAHGGDTVTKVLSTAHAFARRDVEHPDVRVTLGGRAVDVTGDEEGFYEARLPGPFPAGRTLFRVELNERTYQAAPVEVPVDVVDPKGVVVVTDIDDTIADTGVTKGKLALVERIATSNAADMKALEGAAAALVAAGAPIVYLTASPIELAPRISEWLTMTGFPAGPLFLRRYKEDGLGNPGDYKRARLEQILKDYPHKQLVLIGDNGESDPEIFAGVARASGRVAAIYIRATLSADAKDPRYAGQTLFRSWAEVRLR